MEKQVCNPYLPSWEYIPDGEPRVFGERLYIYGSHDAFAGTDFCVNDYVIWSTPVNHLGEWKKEGIAYRATQDPKNKEGKMHMCAPDCVQGIDGRYYLYYQLHMLKCTSVAVSDKPEGPFTFYGYVQHPDGTPWGDRKGDTFAFDPGILVDDDGKVYCYIGFGALGFMRKVFQMRRNNVDYAVCLHLDSDMQTVIGEEHPIVPSAKFAKGTAYEGHAFYEASSIRKINGKYYYVYSSEQSHDLCYAVSDKPDRDFVYGGVLISIADLGFKGNTKPLNYTGNTHGGMAEVNGQWYIFYHRQTNRVKCSRQGCAEKIEILSDGSIPQVEVTSCGLNNGPLSACGSYEARIACNLSGANGMCKSDEAAKVDKMELLPYFTQTGKDREENGDQYIANLQNQSWCGFKYFSFDGTEICMLATARCTGEGVLKVYTDQKDKCIAEIKITRRENWTQFQTKIPKITGILPIYFIYEGTGRCDFLKFEIKSVSN